MLGNGGCIPVSQSAGARSASCDRVQEGLPASCSHLSTPGGKLWSRGKRVAQPAVLAPLMSPSLSPGCSTPLIHPGKQQRPASAPTWESPLEPGLLALAARSQSSGEEPVDGKCPLWLSLSL